MGISLSDVYKDFFTIGAAVNGGSIKSHGELLKKHFGSITAENSMKFSETHPAEGKYTFEQADALADFAAKNSMKIRGHTLVWHHQTPDWVFEYNGNEAPKDVLLGRMREHIKEVAGRYLGKVYCWDVVNEAVEDSAGGYLRESKWLGIIGEGFIAEAFKCAHEADPSAKLFYNDYNACDPKKSGKIFRLAKSLKDSGVPIHGIGIQGHWNIYAPTEDEIKKALDLYASLGLELQVTEMDISLFAQDDKTAFPSRPPEEMLERQAEYYGRTFELFREYKNVITGVTFWGVADDMTWLDYFPVPGRKNWPLLFDENHEEKQAFRNITDF